MSNSESSFRSYLFNPASQTGPYRIQSVTVTKGEFAPFAVMVRAIGAKNGSLVVEDRCPINALYKALEVPAGFTRSTYSQPAGRRVETAIVRFSGSDRAVVEGEARASTPVEAFVQAHVAAVEKAIALSLAGVVDRPRAKITDFRQAA